MLGMMLYIGQKKFMGVKKTGEGAKNSGRGAKIFFVLFKMIDIIRLVKRYKQKEFAPEFVCPPRIFTSLHF